MTHKHSTIRQGSWSKYWTFRNFCSPIFWRIHTSISSLAFPYRLIDVTPHYTTPTYGRQTLSSIYISLVVILVVQLSVFDMDNIHTFRYSPVSSIQFQSSITPSLSHLILTLIIIVHLVSVLELYCWSCSLRPQLRICDFSVFLPYWYCCCTTVSPPFVVLLAFPSSTITHSIVYQVSGQSVCWFLRSVYLVCCYTLRIRS